MEDKRKHQYIDCTVIDCKYIDSTGNRCSRNGIAIGQTHNEHAWCDSYEYRYK